MSSLFMFRKAGFTLVEMLLAASLLSVIGASVLAAFVNGTGLWERVTARLTAESVNVSLDRMSIDLRNGFLFESVPFLGRDDQMSLPIFVSPTEKSQGIGRVQYSFNRSAKTLDRRQSSFSDIYRNHSGLARVLIKRVERMKLEYYYHDPETGDFGWTSVWPDDGVSFDENKKEVLPLAVRIELGVRDDGVLRDFSRTISIPAACCRVKPED